MRERGFWPDVTKEAKKMSMDGTYVEKKERKYRGKEYDMKRIISRARPQVANWPEMAWARLQTRSSPPSGSLSANSPKAKKRRRRRFAGNKNGAIPRRISPNEGNLRVRRWKIGLR